jgi:hypothetical protein
LIDTLVQIIFGWPAIIVSLLVTLSGLIWKRFWLLLVAAVVFFPVSVYLSSFPAMRVLGLFLPVFQLGAAIAVRARKLPLAWVLASPVFIVSAVLAYLVLTQ